MLAVTSFSKVFVALSSGVWMERAQVLECVRRKTAAYNQYAFAPII
jgi:hypothetical protein